MDNVKTVSLCVVALNEENYIGRLLDDLYNQSFSHANTEILLIDGMSCDNTKQIMTDFKKKYESEYISIKVLDNQKKIQAAGWNVAINNYSTDVLIRIDAHTHIPSEFTSLNMEVLNDGENVSGGVRPCLIDDDSNWAKTLLETENSLFGSSISKARHAETKQYVNSMFHAAYRRNVIEDVGLFNEDLLRTEDNEYHYRVRKAGYKLCFDPRIVSYQYARPTLKKMAKQKYANGYWIGKTIKQCPGCISIYHMVPLVFLLAIIFSTVLACAGYRFLSIMLWSLYLLFCLACTLMSVLKDGFIPQKALMPVLFFVLHIEYGIGTLFGLLK